LQTAFSITNANSLTSSVTPGTVTLTVDFHVHNNGPAHVAGLIVTTDYWATTATVPAVFQAHGDGFEYWRAKYSFASSSPVAFEFVIFCDDFGAKDGLARIWNTNGGHRFRARG
jgi:hypothetical protein